MSAIENNGVLALLCDTHGTILDVISCGLPFDCAPTPGMAFTALLDRSDAEKATEFLRTTRQRRACSEWELLVLSRGRLLPLRFAGAYETGKCLILAGARFGMVCLADGLAGGCYKSSAELKSLASSLKTVLGTPPADEGWALEELTRLNNELTNAQRELAQRNALLESANRELTHAVEQLQRVEAESRKRELQLAESEERYRTMIEHSNDLIWTLDSQGCFTFASKRCEEVTGYRFEEFRGRPFTPLVVEEDLPETLAAFQDVLAGHPRSFEARVRRLDGSVLRISANIAPIWKSGVVTGVVAFGRDVTLEREAASALRVNEERSRLVTRATNDAIWDLDLVTGRLWWNDQYDKLFGPRSESTACNVQWWYDGIHPEDRNRIISSFNRALTGADSQWTGEYRFVRPDGRLTFVLDRAYIVRDPSGTATRMLGAMTDITERRQAQSELRRLSAQLMNLQEEERRRIARELHDSTAQKLAGIIMNLGLLEDSASGLSVQVRKLVAESLVAAEDCTQEIRTISHLLHPPLLDELGLDVALDTYVAGFALRSGIKVALEVDPGLEGMPHEVSLALFRVVQESLGNVKRHSGSKTAKVQLAWVKGRIILEVSDAGRGISPEVIEQLNSRRTGLGVGIMGMRERLAQMDGTLEIDSSSQGTTIRAIIPLAQPKL